ncbi:hypothetical protein [Bradyrhizobium genosp. SA-3]|uniref:hypothetical protein n=1 Tax=Bradyrhizobium genosp. SA-3 TaxID=508868 RepID=UPI0013EEB1CC|nr:hypothetical protein [Bradyrhizobium genosp. SA-3]
MPVVVSFHHAQKFSQDSGRFILNRIDRRMLRRERRRLLLSNAAIDAYRLRPVLVTLDA